jgi:3-hydroxyisobutyrate dehydrogenase-like beta-hydroxyacid dehydrogenase
MQASCVGIVGLGLVGKALSQRLLAAGYEVSGWDVSETARGQAGDLGVRAMAELTAVSAPTVLLSLPDSSVVSQVLWDDGLAAALPPGTAVLDTTTGTARDAVTNHQRLAEQGVRFVDVTLSGSSEEIARGEATALIGDDEAEASYRSMVEVFASRLFFLGQPGHGCLAKLVVNHVMGLNRAALAEGLALGERAGLAGETLLNVLCGSAAYSRVMDLKGRRMVERDYAPASRIAQHAKDVRLILELAGQVGARAPLEQAHAALLAEAIAAGYGEADNAALIEVFRQPV